MTETAEQQQAQRHPQTPSAKWLAHKKAIEAEVKRTANERAERTREARDGTDYHRAGEPTAKWA